VIEPGELRALEDEVSAAFATRDTNRLPLLGHGEISLVLGWPPGDPTVACKRLPPFRDVAAFERYSGVVRRYIAELRGGGLRVVETELHRVVRPDGRVVGFHVQPALPAHALGTEVLRNGDASLGHPILPAVTDAVVQVTHPRLGVDAQLSNWVWLDGEPWQLDLTTPFLLDDRGRPEFDMTPFLAVLPALVRPLVRREMLSLIRRWTTARGALLDMTAQLLKERLDRWVDPALTEVNARVTPPISRREAARVYHGDRRLWPVLLRLEHANRWWQHNVRRRPFEFLVPDRTTYDGTSAAGNEGATADGPRASPDASGGLGPTGSPAEPEPGDGPLGEAW
jgi:hypothetical protein